MGLKDFFMGYPKGRNLGNEQSVIQATTVTLTEGAPSIYDEGSLKAMCSIVPTGDEHLIISQDYIIYKTDYEFLNALLEGLKRGANKWEPILAGPFWEHIADFIDTEDKSIWIPFVEITNVGWNCETFELSALFGNSVVPFYYYWLELTHGYMWFVQTPVGKGLGEKQYNLMASALAEFIM
jgi:hypothetical protein